MEARVTGPTAMTDITFGTGVKECSKGIHPTSHTPKMYRDIITVIRTTKIDVGWDECWHWGNRWGDMTAKGGLML